MNILLTGASGFVGRNIHAALRAGGHRVRSVSRSEGCDFAQLCQPNDWLPLLEGVNAVINCVGIIGEQGSQRFDTLHTDAPKALFNACAAVGVRRVIQISALGADVSAFSAYHLSKLAADDHLRSLDLDWWVLRPSLIYGKGGSSAEQFLRLARGPLIPLLQRGQQRLQPVHISDLVACVLRALTANNSQQTLDIASHERVTFAAWLQRMRLAQGLGRGRELHIPLWLALLAMRLGQPFNPMARVENLRMLQRCYDADGWPVEQFLGRPLLAWAPELFFTDANTEHLAGRAA